MREAVRADRKLLGRISPEALETRIAPHEVIGRKSGAPEGSLIHARRMPVTKPQERLWRCHVRKKTPSPTNP